MLPTATGSPTANPVTAGPTAVTMPVNSCPGTKGALRAAVMDVEGVQVGMADTAMVDPDRQVIGA